jgi:hypothetical protein
MIGGGGARGKLSTLSVDKFAEKLAGGAKIPCFQAASLICLFFRQLIKILKRKERFLPLWQIPEKSREFMKAL